MKNNMIQTNCCELMEIFETAINRIEEMVNGILISNQEKTIEISTPMKVEAEKQMILVCKRGAECFSFLLADKLYKEDRFCENCSNIYLKMSRNFQNITS